MQGDPATADGKVWLLKQRDGQFKIKSMKAKELRIGNYVHYLIRDKYEQQEEWLEQTQIDAHDLILLSETEDADYRPIPITEDWLMKFGFKNKKYWFKTDNHYRFALSNGLLHCSIGNNDTGFAYRIIKYVHELQNLFLAITGEELTIKSQTNG